MRYVTLFLLFFIAGGGIVAFKTSLATLSFTNVRPAYKAELLDMVSIHGSVKVDDLNLSNKEVKKINFAALKHRRLFPRVDMRLDMEDKFAPIQVESATMLEMSLVLVADDNSDVTCWTRKVSRKELVPSMVRFMDRAASEFTHYRNIPDPEKRFKRLYI